MFRRPAKTESLPEDARQKGSEVEGVASVDVTLTFEPPYTQERMSEAAKLALGLM